MAEMYHSRALELIYRYTPRPATRDLLDAMVVAEKVASGYAIVTDESQPVDDETLSADIDEMREAIATWQAPFPIGG